MELWPQKEDIIQTFNWLLNNNQKIKNPKNNIEAIKNYYLDPKSTLNYRCFAGQRNLVVYPNGDTTFCFKGRKIGNLTEEKIKPLLKKATAERRAIKNCPKYCRIVGCNFSRGILEFIRDKIKK